MSEHSSQSNGERKPPAPPKVTEWDDEPHGEFPPGLYAPAVEGPVIRPKGKPRIVREEA